MNALASTEQDPASVQGLDVAFGVAACAHVVMVRARIVFDTLQARLGPALVRA